MSIVISNMNMPSGCQKCKFFKKHLFGNGLDYSYSCILGAKDFPMPWIRQMDERASDCPIESLPSVNPQPKIGHWIRWYELKEYEHYIDHIPYCKCSECGKEYDPHSSQFIKYCSECGAKMIEPRESEG